MRYRGLLADMSYINISHAYFKLSSWISHEINDWWSRRNRGCCVMKFFEIYIHALSTFLPDIMSNKRKCVIFGFLIKLDAQYYGRLYFYRHWSLLKKIWKRYYFCWNGIVSGLTLSVHFIAHWNKISAIEWYVIYWHALFATSKLGDIVTRCIRFTYSHSVLVWDSMMLCCENILNMQIFVK